MLIDDDAVTNASTDINIGNDDDEDNFSINNGGIEDDKKRRGKFEDCSINFMIFFSSSFFTFFYISYRLTCNDFSCCY